MTLVLAYLWRILPLSKNVQLRIMRIFQDQFLVAVTGVIFNEKNEVLLFKHTYRSNAWGLPAGYMKAGEHPQEALEREIEEESGFIISIEERLKIRTDRETARLEICYLGFFVGGEFQSSPEVSEFGFFSIENLPLISKKELRVIHTASLMLEQIRPHHLAFADKLRSYFAP